MKLLRILLAAALLGILLAGSCRGATLTCTSCADCNSKILQAGSWDTVQLTQDILDSPASCINSSGKGSIIFDCQGHLIDGIDSGPPSQVYEGIFIGKLYQISYDIEVRNCRISDFNTGIHAYEAINMTIVNVTSSSGMSGISLEYISSSRIINSTFESNIGYGMFFHGSFSNLLDGLTFRANTVGMFAGCSRWNGYNMNNNNITRCVFENNSGGMTFYNDGGLCTPNAIYSNLIYNNVFNNTRNADLSAVTSVLGTNWWSAAKDCTKANIMGGPCTGGNYWTSPGGNFSDTCADADLDGICDSPYTLSAGNVDSLPLAKIIPQDTTPPVRSGGSPSGTLPAGTTQATLSLATNEPATCRYSASPGVPYSSMPSTFSATGGTSHSSPVSGLQNGTGYSYYARCQDAAGNPNADDFAISFSVASPPDYPPSITFVSPTLQNNTNVPGNYIEVNASLSESPDTCLLNWFSGAWANYTMNKNGLFCYRNMTVLTNFTYQFNVYANDTAGNMNVSETRQNGVSYSPSDATPPALVFITPANNTQATQAWILVNVSANEPLSSCLLNWNGTANESMTVSGSYCWINKTSLPQGAYSFRVYANDTSNNWNATETRWVSVNLTVQPPEPVQSPLMIVYSINPRSVRTGSNVTLSINATSNSSISALILNVTMPNSTWNAFYLSGNATMDYSPQIPGIYGLVVFANDTQGWNLTVADNFTASNLITFNSTAMTYDSTAIPFKLELYYPGTDSMLSGFNSPSGVIANQEILDQSYDMLFKSYDDMFQVMLRNVNISQNLERAMGFDDPQVAGYPITYAVQNGYAASSASVRIYYSGLNADHIGLYKCDSWNFTARLCTGSWDPINYSQDKDNYYIAFDVSSFSGFSLKQEPFCGDGICQSNENSENCSEDCACADGENMSCGVNRGECRTGNITCQDGAWGTECVGEIKPSPETCNGKDDNCDGIIDNVDNGTSVQSTQCQCYNGGSPLASEICNGIDDDCDGQIDNGADCCTEGDTRTFGTSLTRGICHPGMCACIGGAWKNCTEAVTAQKEVCNDGLDNDCNGLTDAADPACIQSTCSNGVKDGNEEGVDCGGECAACPDFTMVWIALSATGAIVLGILLFLYFKLRNQGKELTWEELAKKWTPAE